MSWIVESSDSGGCLYRLRDRYSEGTGGLLVARAGCVTGTSLVPKTANRVQPGSSRETLFFVLRSA